MAILAAGKAKFPGKVNAPQLANAVEGGAEELGQAIGHVLLGLREPGHGRQGVVCLVPGMESRRTTLCKQQRGRWEGADSAQTIQAPTKPHRPPRGRDNPQRTLPVLGHQAV